MGYGGGTATLGDQYPHALLWTAVGAFVDLNLSGAMMSQALGTDGMHQVGSVGGPLGFGHATMWSGTVASAVDLNPSGMGFIGTAALAVSGGQQVGFGQTGNPHAVVWFGTAASAVDLNPAGFTASVAYNTDGTHQVGYASIGTSVNSHAVMWSGTAASAVDLGAAPLSGLEQTVAYATNGTVEAGMGYHNVQNAPTHALMWSGTAASVFDLQTLLPAGGSWTDSKATSVDAAGNIFGVAHGTYNTVTGTFAVEWSPVPEPGTAVLMALGAVALASAARRRGKKTDIKR